MIDTLMANLAASTCFELYLNGACCPWILFSLTEGYKACSPRAVFRFLGHKSLWACSNHTKVNRSDQYIIGHL